MPLDFTDLVPDDDNGRPLNFRQMQRQGYPMAPAGAGEPGGDPALMKEPPQKEPTQTAPTPATSGPKGVSFDDLIPQKDALSFDDLIPSQAQRMENAGQGAPEIAAEQGMIPEPTQSAPALREAAGRIAGEAKAGFDESPPVLTQEAQDWLDKTGLGGITRTAGGLLALSNAALKGLQQTVTELGATTGFDRLARDVNAYIESVGMTGAPHMGHVPLGEIAEHAAGRAAEGLAAAREHLGTATEAGEAGAIPGPAPPAPGAQVSPEAIPTVTVTAHAPTPTTPEPPADIHAQVKALADPNNPKDAVFIAPGTKVPTDLPWNIWAIEGPEGTLLTDNPAKATEFRDAPSVDDAMIARLLEYPETKEQAVASGEPAVVQGVNHAGDVVAESLASPEGVPAAEAAAASQAPDVRVVSPEQAQARRADATPTLNAMAAEARARAEVPQEVPEASPPPETAVAPVPGVEISDGNIKGEAPIVRFRKDAEAIEASVPPVQDGLTRLWRGNRPGEVGNAQQFTNDLPGIALPFRQQYGGPVSFVDVPTSDLSRFAQTSGAAPGAEFYLPNDIASKASAIDVRPVNGPPSSEPPPGTANPYLSIPKEPQRISSFLKSIGGVQDDGGDIRSSLGGAKYRPGLINKNGLPLDDAALRAWEAGYFPDLGDDRPSINDLREALHDDLNGRPRYSFQDDIAVANYTRAIEHNNEIDQLAATHGIDTTGKTAQQIFDEAAIQPLGQVSRDIQASSEAHDTAYQQAQDATREWWDGQSDEAWNPGDFYGEDQSRSLEDLERERKQKETAVAAQQFAGRNEEPQSAGPNQADVQGGGGPRADSAGPAGRPAPEGAQDLLGNPIREASERVAEPTIRNDPNQIGLAGMEPSAVQAQAARDQAGRGALLPPTDQLPANEGLFAGRPIDQDSMLAEGPAGPKVPDQAAVQADADGAASPRYVSDNSAAYSGTIDAQAREHLVDGARRVMRSLGLPQEIGLRLVDRIVDAAGNSADAAYTRGMINLALDTDPGVMPAKLFHEAIHAMMDERLGLLNDTQRDVLLNAADRWLKRGPTMAEAGRSGNAVQFPNNREGLLHLGYREAEIREEAIARMGEEAFTRGSKPPYQRMLNFIRRVGNWLHGEGFRTADDVFDHIMRGGNQADRVIETTHGDPSGTLYSFPGMLFDPAAWRRAFGVREDRSLEGVREKLREANAGMSPGRLRQQMELGLSAAEEKVFSAKVVDEIRSWFAPTSRGPLAKSMESIVRRRAAQLAQSSAQSSHALDRLARGLDRLPVEEQVAITDRAETGEHQPTPALQQAISALREQQDLWKQRIQSLGKGYLDQARENYMGHIWGNYREWREGVEAKPQSDAERMAVAQGISKRPISGSGAFLKQRTFDTQAEGIAAGLIPVTTNPIRLQTIKLREMQKFYHGTRMLDEIKSSGLARWVPADDEASARSRGLEKLDDAGFKPRAGGGWYAPEPAARIFNRYVSRGLAGQSSIYDGVRKAGNILNSAQLALSGFHATFVTLDSMISRMALGLQQVSHGDVLRGAGNFVSSLTPLAPYQTVRRGAALRKAWLEPALATPEMLRLADRLNSAGGRVSMDQFYRSNASGSFFTSLKDLQNPTGAFRDAAQMVRDTPLAAPFKIVGRLMDTINEPLMGQLVPRMKLGVFADMAEDFMRRNPDATPEQTSDAMIKAWDSVENRMGQMTYDNVFWHKTLKDIAFLAQRSVGWNLGTIREIAGSGVDGLTQIKRMMKGQYPELTNRMAYTIAMPILTAVLGASITYLTTGHGPEQMMDYFYPPSSAVEPGKEPGRLSIPGYIKDVVAYANAPVQTLLNKLNPLAETAQEIYHNRDYYGGIIYDPMRDNPLVAYPEYLLNQTLPFSIRSSVKARAEGTGATTQALSFWGIQPAPTSITNPERAERFEQKQNARAYRKRLHEPNRIQLAP